MRKEDDKVSNSSFLSTTEPCDVLILDAGLRQSLVSIRSLGRHGLRVAALEAAANVPAFSSRWCQYKNLSRVNEGREQYLIPLEQTLNRTAARVLITSSDATVDLIRQHRERLERRVSIALAKEVALSIAINKQKTRESAERLGLAIPNAVTINNVDDLKTALDEIGLPAVIKPVESWVKSPYQDSRLQSALVTSVQEAKDVVENLMKFGTTALFQQLLLGRRESIHLMYAQGQVHARFAQWAKRTDPPLGGASVLRQSIAIPSDTGEQAERLVREIDLEGYSEVEFRRDSEGKPYLMEINPRLSASIGLAVCAGVDFPYLLYQWASGERISVVTNYREGVWMRYLMGDLTATFAALREHGKPGVTAPPKALLDFCTSFFIPSKYDDFDWSDPLPSLVPAVNFAHSMPLRLRNCFSSLSK